MKYLLGSLLILLHTAAIGQYEDSRKMPPLTDDILRNKAQSLINNFTSTVVKSVRCGARDSYSLSSMLQKFTVDALIEVSTPSDPTYRKKLTPARYFNALEGLCSGTKYDSVDIQFIPDLITQAQISRPLNNTCVVTKDITQIFKAYKYGKNVYCDVTVKEVKMVFVPQITGTYKAYISYIAVKDTQRCL